MFAAPTVPKSGQGVLLQHCRVSFMTYPLHLNMMIRQTVSHDLVYPQRVSRLTYTAPYVKTYGIRPSQLNSALMENMSWPGLGCPPRDKFFARLQHFQHDCARRHQPHTVPSTLYRRCGISHRSAGFVWTRTIVRVQEWKENTR